MLKIILKLPLVSFLNNIQIDKSFFKQFLFCLVFIFGVPLFSFAQNIYVPSCDDEDIVDPTNLVFDANILAMRQINVDSFEATLQAIEIDSPTIEKYYNALVAVHNATYLPEREEVINAYQIHVANNQELQNFNLYIDTALISDPNFYDDPINGLKGADSFALGDLGELIDSFQLTLAENHYFASSPLSISDEVLVLPMKSLSFLNLPPLMEQLMESPLIILAEASVNNDVPTMDITGSFNSMYTELTYHFFWNCSTSGCQEEHSWTFRIFEDCSVTYIGEFGDPLPVSSLKSVFTLNLFPNPTADKINLSFLGPPDKDFNIYLFNSIGEMILSQTARTTSGILNLEFSLDGFPIGIYYLSLQNDEQLLTEKILKNY